jgi:multidrug resistance protein, MATE family
MADLALPVVVVQVGLMAMGVADTIMVGHVSATALAAVALGNVYFFAVIVFGMGTLMALDPLVAQAVGAGDEPATARAVQRGLLLALVLAVPIMLALLPAIPVLTFLQQPPEVVPLAAGYARASVPGVLPFLGFVVLRQSLQAMGRLQPIVLTIIAANLVNVVLNWVLIFGHFGLPPGGAVGSAWASSLSRWFMALALLAVGWSVLRPLLHPIRPRAFDLRPLVRVLRLGAPIGAQQQLEFGAFGVIGLLMGLLGTREMAGHQIALNLASLTFMVPLGVSAAAAVLVGQAVGRGDDGAARRSAGAALICGTAFMTASALVFMSVPALLAGIYTSDPGVAAIAAVLIPIAAIFQLFDGWQVVSIGVLRGVGDTRTPMVVNVLGFWLLGIPISIWLGFRTDYGPEGLWLGLVAGLIVVSVILLARVRRRLHRSLRRVHVDDHTDDHPVVSSSSP